ncbi:hypothetical protein PWJ77_09310 [Bacillus sp. CNPSo 3703]|uniref:hypothetical protein n=1 Tax=Bacillus altitudinis TaxID=293387 RepID=UPI00237A3929|nr:hypothetical protein [Bacillus altitudinis]MDE0640669.1 hypothetical protein [Bacillus altitudinis]
MKVFALNNTICKFLLELDEYIEGENEIFTCQFNYSSLNKKILLYKLNFNKKVLNEFIIDLKSVLNGRLNECGLRDLAKQVKFIIEKIDDYTFSIIISKDSQNPQCTIYLEQKIDRYLLNSLHNDTVEFISVF